MVALNEEMMIPQALLQDDDHPEEIDLPSEWESIPTSSAPQYTLYRLLRYLKARSVLEIGTQHGASAAAMALAFRDNGIEMDIYCVDPFLPTGDNTGLETLVRWYDNIYGAGLKQGIHLLVTTSQHILPLIDKAFDFIFIDGSHRYPDVRRDCLLALELLREGGYFLAHDYVIYESVRQACTEVIEEYGLPYHVNSVQTNYRGELCGWIIARKMSNLEISARQLQPRNDSTRELAPIWSSLKSILRWLTK